MNDLTSVYYPIMYIMTDKMDDFIEWSESKRIELGWSQAELARRGGFKKASYNGLVLRRQHKPGDKMIKGLAKAFNISEIFIRRKAGLYPSGLEEDIRFSDWLPMLQELPPNEIEDIEQLLMIKVEKIRRNNKEKGGKVDNEEKTIQRRIN